MIDLSKAALLVVDVQNGFVTPDSAPAVPVVVDLAERWAAAGRPMILTRYLNYPDSPYERLLDWHNLRESPEIDLVDELEPFVGRPGVQMLDKTVYTAFTPEGAALVRDLGVNDLVIVGIATDACVLKTVLDAFELGYTPWVVRDAVASNATRHKAQEVHDSALILMSRLVGAGQVIDSKQVRTLIAKAAAA